ncbi:MAG: phage capsid protein [Herbinix sp.]|nr:phage capsid protein [Herbinix sp.]
MFPVKNVKQAIGVDAAISNAMVDKIEIWSKMYKGEAEWIDNDAVYSLRLEQGIVREFANVTLNEMTSKVTVDKLDKIYQKAIQDLNENLQSGLALGAFIIKPLGEDKVEYVTQDNFIPIEFDSRGRLMKVVFIETKKIKEDDIYRRFEYHAVDKKGLTITNKAFHAKNVNELGREVPLTDVDDWADLVPDIWFPFPKPDFGYYRNPIKNMIDGSFNGVSIYDPKINTIKKADIQFGRLDWEFESGERAVHVDPAALKTDKVTGERKLPRLNKRLYRAVDVSPGDGKELFDTFSPEFREQSFINGLEEYKRDIEFGVGLSYGDISNPAMIEKTATEVKTAKKRKYNMVTAIQSNLKDCLSDLVDALAFYNSLATTGYEYICDFKDSILVDEETERAQDKADVAIGAMTLLEYRMKWYHEDEKTAAKMINEPAEIIP